MMNAWLIFLPFTHFLYCLCLKGTWVCYDGTDEVKYRNWDAAGGQPDNEGRREHCAEVKFKSGRWNDQRCERKRRAICRGALTSMYDICALRETPSG